MISIIKKHKVIAFFTIVLFGIMLSYLATISYVDYKLKDRKKITYDECEKIWSNRGLVTNRFQRNSIESVNNAIAHGARGVEIDHYYDVQLKKFIVSHNYNPYELRNGKLLTLKTLFEETSKDGLYFWLDFKKLRYLKKDQLAEAVSRLELLSKENNLKQRIYVEGADPLNLPAFQRVGFNTIFDIHPLPDNNPLSSFLINLYKIVYYFGDYTVIGMAYGDIDNPIYGTDTREVLGDIPLFVYHVPDEQKLLEALARVPSIKVLLTTDHKMDFFHISNCK